MLSGCSQKVCEASPPYTLKSAFKRPWNTRRAKTYNLHIHELCNGAVVTMTLTFGKCLVLSTCFAVLHGFFAICAFSLCNIECLSSDTDEATKH